MREGSEEVVDYPKFQAKAKLVKNATQNGLEVSLLY